MNKNEAAKILLTLKSSYPSSYAKFTKEEHALVIDLWHDMLTDIPFELVEQAVRAFMATDTKGFPPVVGQIRQKCLQIVKPVKMTEGEAWQLIKAALRNGIYGAEEEHRKLPAELRRIVSVADLRDWAMMDIDEVNTVVHSNFLRAFRAAAERSAQYEALPENIKQMIFKNSQEQLSEGEKVVTKVTTFGGDES